MTDDPKPELTDEELAEFRAFLAERKAKGEAAGVTPGGAPGANLAQATAAPGANPAQATGAPGVSPAKAPGQGVAYIRGGAGMAVDTGRAVRIFVGFCLVALATLVILLFISAVHQNSRLTRLQQHGVPVDVTVTGCVGLASGTGVTQYGFTCRGTFALDGHTYNEVIGGTTGIHAPGDVLHALTIPGSPSVLSVTTAVVHRHSSGTVYITPAILLGVLVAGVIVFGWLLRRRRSHDGAPGPSQSGALAKS